MKRAKIYVIIPAFNEQKHIRSVVKDALGYCKNIILVDDGSTDATSKLMRRFPLTLITLPINMGKGYALRVGVEFAIKNGATGIITLDSDGQHRPEHLPKFVSALKNYDVVFGVRRGHHSVPFVRKLGNKIASALIAFLYGISIQDILCGFRGFTPKAYKRIKWTSDRYGVETEMVAKTGASRLKYAQIPIENIYLDQLKGVSFLDAIEVFLSIPKFKI